MDLIAKIYLGSRLLCSPLEALYTLLIFIVVKEFDATWLQLSLLASVKPLSSLFAFYSSACMHGKQHQFKNYLVAVNIIGVLPTLAFPFVNSCWFYIASYFLFIIGQRATFPVWNSILKENRPKELLSTLLGQAISIQQIIMISFPLFIGYWIDIDKQIWKYLFLSLAVLQASNSLLLLFLPSSEFKQHTTRPSLVSPLVQWREGQKLLMARRDFLSYLLLFFWGGAGLVMMQSTLPIFFEKSLHLSYSSLTMAYSLCKGIALLATTHTWSYWANKISLYRLNFYINLFSLLFIGFIMLSNFHVHWIFAAYLMYGTMQAGCELSWNLSGPFFANEKECTLYSSLNLPLIGIRGALFPFIGQWLLLFTNANTVFLTAGTLCLISLAYAYRLDYSSNAIPKHV